MKHLKVFIFSGFALVSVVALRLIQLIFLTDSKTGFFKSGMEGIGTALMIFSVVLIAVSALLVLLFKKEKINPVPKQSTLLGCAAIFAGIAHLTEPVIYKADLSSVPDILMGLRLIMLIAAGGVFCLFGLTVILNLKPRFGLTTVLIIAWVVRLMSTFISFTGMSNISENLYDVLMLVMSLIFMLYFGKAICGLSKDEYQLKVIISGVSAVLFTAASALPAVILSFTNSAAITHAPIDSPVTGLFTAFFIAVYLINICKTEKN